MKKSKRGIASSDGVKAAVNDPLVPTLDTKSSDRKSRRERIRMDSEASKLEEKRKRLFMDLSDLRPHFSRGLADLESREAQQFLARLAVDEEEVVAASSVVDDVDDGSDTSNEAEQLPTWVTAVQLFAAAHGIDVDVLGSAGTLKRHYRALGMPLGMRPRYSLGSMMPARVELSADGRTLRVFRTQRPAVRARLVTVGRSAVLVLRFDDAQHLRTVEATVAEETRRLRQEIEKSRLVLQERRQFVKQMRGKAYQLPWMYQQWHCNPSQHRRELRQAQEVLHWLHANLRSHCRYDVLRYDARSRSLALHALADRAALRAWLAERQRAPDDVAPSRPARPIGYHAQQKLDYLAARARCSPAHMRSVQKLRSKQRQACRLAKLNQ